MSSPKFPSIAMPSPTMDSVMATLLSMKETIELLTGQVGSSATTVASKAALDNLQAIGFSSSQTLGDHIGTVSDVANNAATAVALETTQRTVADTTLTKNLAAANVVVTGHTAQLMTLNGNYHITGALAAGSFAITGAQLASGGTVYPLSALQAGTIQLGGVSALFPAITNTGTTLNARLADNSGDAALTVDTLQTKHIFTVATLPAPVAILEGMHASVSDAAAPAYNATVAGGGAQHVPVYCNGSAWVCA